MRADTAAVAMTLSAAPEVSLTYALRWRVAGVMPGAHPGIDNGQSGRFRQIVPFDRSPDPRRIDLRSTVRNPFGLLHVRQFEQRASVQVEMLIDMSASMAFGMRASHYSTAIELATALSRTAHAIGDAFGLAACSETVELRQPARRGDPAALVDRLESLRPHGRGAGGLIEAARELVGRRKLVFIVSDFAFPLETLEVLLDALAAHDVVPVQIVEDIERLLPHWGLAELADLESGRRRLVILRPALRARWRLSLSERQARVVALCLTRGRRPFVLQGEFDAVDFADYLLAA